jgi:hypothetical protein
MTRLFKVVSRYNRSNFTTIFISLNWDNVKHDGYNNLKSESNISLYLIEKHNKNKITFCGRTILGICRNKKTCNTVIFQ